ncbi:hypothetical protein MLIT_21490 [Mycolicibacterium litorale]|uniref:Uncharacterized protein n=1 Tax=Mycolicibacterium litorale TaxID=758802 RepID=A0AAD1MUN3_9MYCO|nr:hypothetical protein MLIT_21490 [Mycolicibacterium litorale]
MAEPPIGLVAKTTMTAANSAHNAENTLSLAAMSPPVVRTARPSIIGGPPPRVVPDPPGSVAVAAGWLNPK